MPFCLTFDVERDYYETIGGREGLAYKDKSFSMLESIIPKLLNISDQYNIPYTFFLCGEVAENCSHLFDDIKRHSIGVHTHPFTNKALFKGLSPNDHQNDYLSLYSYEEQYNMIQEDLELIKSHLGVNPKIFRAGRHSVNQNTFKALDRLDFKIDCSMYPPYQLIGWRPFIISNTSLWEVPSYSVVSPEIYPTVRKLFKLSSVADRLFKGIYVGLIHPMTMGNPKINTKLLFDNYIRFIEFMLDSGFDFITIENAVIASKDRSKVFNSIGKAINVLTHPIHTHIKNRYAKSILNGRA